MQELVATAAQVAARADLPRFVLVTIYSLSVSEQDVQQRPAASVVSAELVSSSRATLLPSLTQNISSNTSSVPGDEAVGDLRLACNLHLF